MAWSWGDSFDLYAAPADMLNGYWDSGINIANPTLVAGRFSGSRALQVAGGNFNVVKSSGVNDAVHHLVVSYQQTAALSGTNLGAYLNLFDGTTAQCIIFFRSDGAILLYSGGISGGVPSGSLLDTYTGAVTVINTWYAFEFEVVINSATGSWAVRKNGNNINDHALGSLNTRVSANNYANKLQIGQNVNVTSQLFDDLFWQSGAAAGAWLGDIRCYARMPASDQSVTFSRSTGASNFSCVDEAQQNALTDYVFDSTPGDADFYGLTSIASTPAQVIATVTRAYVQKSDAGTRTAAVQLKSGATTVASPTLVLTTSGFLWAWRMDLTDPATGAAWTAAAVNNAQVGPKVIA